MSLDSMSRGMVVFLNGVAGVIPPPGNAVVMVVSAIIEVAVHIVENKKANPDIVDMLRDLCERSCILSDLVRRSFGKLSCEKDLLELTAKKWQRTLGDLRKFVTEIDNRSYLSRICHSNEEVKRQCKDFSALLDSYTTVFVLFAVTAILKNQSQCPANSWVTEGSGEGVCPPSTTAADVNDDIVKLWFENTDDDKKVSAAEIEAIVHKLSEQADAESIVEERLLRLQSDAAVHDEKLVQSLLSPLRSFQDRASETEPWPAMNTDPGAHPFDVKAHVGKRARIKRALKEKKREDPLGPSTCAEVRDETRF